MAREVASLSVEKVAKHVADLVDRRQVFPELCRDERRDLMTEVAELRAVSLRLRFGRVGRDSSAGVSYLDWSSGRASTAMKSGAARSRSVRPSRSHLVQSVLIIEVYEDTEGYRIELRFLRDKEKREVDFLVFVDYKPWFAVEVKTRKERVSSHLPYFGDRLAVPYLYQVVWELDVSHTKNDVVVMSPTDFLGALR